LNRHHFGLFFGVIFSENRHPLFGIMPYSCASMMRMSRTAPSPSTFSAA
jgi:hypothetical protein